MSASTTPILEVRDMSVSFGVQKALDSVSLTVPPGAIFGLIGPNGAGKSTLIDTITGYLPGARGDVLFDGEPVTGLGPHQRAARGLSRTFQTLELFEDLTVRENVLVAAEHRTWRGRFTDLVRPTRLRERSTAVDRVLELLDIGHLAERLPAELSHGHRNLVSVARAMTAQPRLVLLDEPAAGLDHDETQALGHRLRQMVKEGVTVLLVDHDMSLVLGICDQIHVLDFGRTIAEGPPADIRTSTAVIDAYLGVAHTESEEQP